MNAPPNAPSNPIDQLLQQELNLLIDRLAAASPDSDVDGALARRPDLLARLADVESRLSSLRLALVAGYVAWRQMLDECADLWALADLGEESDGERRAA